MVSFILTGVFLAGPVGSLGVQAILAGSRRLMLLLSVCLSVRPSVRPPAVDSGVSIEARRIWVKGHETNELGSEVEQITA